MEPLFIICIQGGVSQRHFHRQSQKTSLRYSSKNLEDVFSNFSVFYSLSILVVFTIHHNGQTFLLSNIEYKIQNPNNVPCKYTTH